MESRLLLLCSAASLASANSVWPQPLRQYDTGVTYALAPQSTFQFLPQGPGAAAMKGSSILRDAFKRYRGIFFLHSPVAGAHRRQLLAQSQNAGAPPISSLAVRVSSPDESLSLGTDQSYNLTVASPQILLSASTVYGALCGLETLSQLIDRGVFVNGTRIEDSPRYNFRAFMIDTSRHYYPVGVILQHLDAMAYSKMNVLHWHLVDSIAFPYESAAFPELSGTGAYSPSHVYTADDIRRVVAYARNRGIRVVPEFDTPGHVREGYTALDPPILTKCYDPKTGAPLSGVGATGPLNPTLNETYAFLGKLYAELRTLFPDRFVHVGGDEVDPACWASNPQIASYMKAHGLASFADLETLFEQRLLDMLRAHNTSYIVWQEIFDNGAKIARDTVIDVWKSPWQDEMAKVAKAGYRSVLSAPFYLNYISYGEDWPKYFAVEPSNFTGGAGAAEAGLIGGVEACMWSEFVDAANFVPRSWPRASAVAARGWSDKEVRDVGDARRRIHEFRCKLLARGINAEPITNGGDPGELQGRNYCPQEWTPQYVRPWGA